MMDENKYDLIYEKVDYKGLEDKDIEMKMRSIINEADREFETETSKLCCLELI